MSMLTTGLNNYKITCDNCDKVMAKNQTTDEAISYIKSNLTVGIMSPEIGIKTLKYFCCKDCLNRYIKTHNVKE